MRANRWTLLLLAAALAAGTLPAEPGEGPVIGQPAPQFMLKTHAGEDFYTRDYAGEPRGKRFRQERNVLVLSFFASWCKPCKQEIPVLHELSSAYAGDGVKFFLVNKGEEKGIVDDCIFSDKITLPVLLDPYEVACKKFRLKELPTLAIIDKTGTLAYHHTGYAEGFRDTLRYQLDKLLGKLPKVDSAAIRKAKADSIAAAKAKTKKKPAKAGKSKAGVPPKATSR